MGWGRKKKKIRLAVVDWNCLGHFGYGQGRAVAEFGVEYMQDKSACMDICSKSDRCRRIHHGQMDKRFPRLSELVRRTAIVAKVRRVDIISHVVEAMKRSAEMGLEEALEVKATLSRFKIDEMTDHYRCGQFENIQRGLSRDNLIPKDDSDEQRPTS